MRVIGTTLLVMAVLATPSASAQLPPVGGGSLPDLQVDPPELPLPPLPLPEVPDLPPPTPAPTPAPPDAPAAAGAPRVPAGAGQARPARSGSTPTAGGAVTRAPAA